MPENPPQHDSTPLELRYSLAAQRLKTRFRHEPRIYDLQRFDVLKPSYAGNLFQYVAEEFLEREFDGPTVGEDEFLTSVILISEQPDIDYELSRFGNNTFMIQRQSDIVPVLVTAPDALVLEEHDTNQFRLAHLVECKMTAKKSSPIFGNADAFTATKTVTGFLRFLKTPEGADLLTRALKMKLNKEVSVERPELSADDYFLLINGSLKSGSESVIRSKHHYLLPYASSKLISAVSDLVDDAKADDEMRVLTESDWRERGFH